ncbi:nuclear condensing complex subunit [Mycena vulgaris]|nr:nuclear condensing complex subunit [Mycena vulgaris]
MPPKRKRPQDSDPDYPDSSAKRREIFWQTSSAPSLRCSKFARHPKREGTPNSLQMIFEARSSFIGSKSTSGLNGMMNLLLDININIDAREDLAFGQPSVDLHAAVSQIFDQAQTSAANHQKNFVALHILHLEAAKKTEVRNEPKPIGEHEFEAVFKDMLSRVLPAKKAERGADRVVRFVGGYVKFLNEKAAEGPDQPDSDSEESDTTASRFTAKLLKFLLKGFQSKDKVVRYRVVFIVTEMVADLGEIDDEIYADLRRGLLDRIHDREPMIRVQVVQALSKLARSEDKIPPLTMVNMPVNPTSLPSLLTRSRDTEATIRKLLYSFVLTMSSAPPLTLTIAQRELLVRNGLHDREKTVRAAAAALIATWVEISEPEELASRLASFDLSKTEETTPTTDDKAQKIMKMLITFLHMFNLREISAGAGDKGSGEQRMEGAGIPVLTSCAFRIQDGYNTLSVEDEEREEAGQGWEAQMFILSELLTLALNLDYGDEIGRKKMFALVCESLPHFHHSLINNVFKERDLIRLVAEIVHELRDPGEEEDHLNAAHKSLDTISLDSDADMVFGSLRKSVRPREDMTAEEQTRVDEIDLRCLFLSIGMLERVNHWTFEGHSTLQGILDDLIIPSVKRKEMEFLMQGVIALGLICLISQLRAVMFLPALVAQAKADVTEPLKLKLLEIIFDVLMAHARHALGGEADNALDFLVAEIEAQSEKDSPSPKILTLLSVGMAKLVVHSLMVIYFSPCNAENQELKQSLAYFALAYSHSSPQNQRVMGKIFICTFEKLSALCHNDEEKSAINLAQVADMWLHWTDPFQVQRLEMREPKPEIPVKRVHPFVQFELANEIIRALLKVEMPKDDKRDKNSQLLMYTLNLRRPLDDAITNNAFKKFDASISKKFEKQLEDFDEAEYRKLEELKELFDFFDDIIPEDDDEAANNAEQKREKKRRADSIMCADENGISSECRKATPQIKRRRLSPPASDCEDNTAKGTHNQTLSKRPVARQPEVIVISSDSDEDHEAMPMPIARKAHSKVVNGRSRKVKQEAIIDVDIDDLFEDGTSMGFPQDSILDNSDEEDEVYALLNL